MQSETITAIMKGYAGGREFTLPRAWIQEQALPRIAHVDMSAAEPSEGPYARFLRERPGLGECRRVCCGPLSGCTASGIALPFTLSAAFPPWYEHLMPGFLLMLSPLGICL